MNSRFRFSAWVGVRGSARPTWRTTSPNWLLKNSNCGQFVPRSQRAGRLVGGARMSRRGRGEGSIVQRPDGRWVARVTLPDGKRKAFYGQTRQEVADKLTDALAARRKGMLVTSGRRSLGDWLEQWLNDWVENYVARTTYERYRGIVRRYIVPQLGRKTLEQLTAPHIQRYYSHLNERGFAAATISLHHTVLYHSLRDAKRVG